MDFSRFLSFFDYQIFARAPRHRRDSLKGRKTRHLYFRRGSRDESGDLKIVVWNQEVLFVKLKQML